MTKKIKQKRKKGFTLVELVVVIAILAILALIMVPNYKTYIDKSRDARIQNDLRTVYSAAEVLIDDSDGIKLSDAVEKSDNFNESIKSLVNFSSDESEEQHYGRYRFLDKEGNLVIEYTDTNNKIHYYPKEIGMVPVVDPTDIYLATDDDFTWVDTSEFEDAPPSFYLYTGTNKIVKLPESINNTPLTSTSNMFRNGGTLGLGFNYTAVEKVILTHANVTDMSGMFFGSQATTLDLSSFDTSNVTNMYAMFEGSKATTLDLSSFNTSNVTNMGFMFLSSKATTLDLSSFDTSNVTKMGFMFLDCQATKGYARTQADANRFNASSTSRPTGLTFVVKP